MLPAVSIAQLAARGSHNPKVVSSILVAEYSLSLGEHVFPPPLCGLFPWGQKREAMERDFVVIVGGAAK